MLLFPGGVRESNHGKGENKFFWPAETDFVRAAAKYDALIVPFGAVGAADSVTFLRDKTGEQPNIPSARRWANRTEDFRFPLAVPTNPRRFYFRFGEADLYERRGRVGSWTRVLKSMRNPEAPWSRV